MGVSQRTMFLARKLRWSRPLHRTFCAAARPPTITVAIVAHVDHGKTTLVDCMLKHCDEAHGDRAMDSMSQEKERGITIMSKVTSMQTIGARFNVVDTPGHADFGGEVERVMGMVDGVVLLVDATEGPMPQTKFVVAKALEAGHNLVAVLNKVDRDTSDCTRVENELFDLLVDLGATDEQLEFPFLYASAKQGWASHTAEEQTECVSALFDTIKDHIKPRKSDTAADFKMLVSMMEYDQYVGRVLTGRVAEGTVNLNDEIRALCHTTGEVMDRGRVSKIQAPRGLSREVLTTAEAGDVIMVAGLSKATVSHTLCAPGVTEAISAPAIDPPTISMMFGVNDSPLGGKEGDKLTSAMIRDRVRKEIENNISFTMGHAEGNTEGALVMARGSMQLGILIEEMRREGFELSVGPPQVLFGEDENGKRTEPVEEVMCEMADLYSGGVMEALAKRKGEVLEITPATGGRTKILARVPSRTMMGYRGEFNTATHGTGVMFCTFHGYEAYRGGNVDIRRGVIVASAQGTATTYSLATIEPRGELFIENAQPVYEGMIIGEHSKNSDLEVNPTKAKALTNMRASGNDETIRLSPPRQIPLEEAMGYIQEDEMIEITPTRIAMRKAHLNPTARKSAARKKAQMSAAK